MRATIPHIAFFALAVLLLGAGNEPPSTVNVDGVQLSYKDVLELTGLSMTAIGIVQSGIIKQPSEMPKASPYVYYAGTDAGGKPIVWVSNVVKSGAKLPGAEMAELMRESEQAGLLAALATGTGDAAVRQIYMRVRNDPAKLASVGAKLGEAMSKMSEQTVEYSNHERQWMFRNIPAGTQRARAEQMLREHGLLATGSADNLVVSLPGAFEPGCYFSTNVTLTFDDKARLYKIDLSRPIPDCL